MPLTGMKHHAVVRLARHELAKGVREHPLGSNTGADVIKYQRSTWLGGTRWPWCVAYWQWLCREAGLKVPWLGAGAFAALDWARKAGFSVPLHKAGVGDAVVLNIGSGHMAILLEDAPEGDVPTINGNVGDRVALHMWPRHLVRGCIHIPEVHNAPAPKPKLFEVVTSVNGHKKVVFSGRRRVVAGRLGQLFNKYGGITVRRKAKARK